MQADEAKPEASRSRRTKAAVAGFAKELIGKTLVTHQTGPKGRKVHRLLLEEGANIAKELYLSILVDRDTGWPTFIASTEGGMEIEEVAEKTPEKIIKEAIDPAVGFQGHNGRNVAFALGLQNMEPAVINPFVRCSAISIACLWRSMQHSSRSTR